MNINRIGISTAVNTPNENNGRMTDLLDEGFKHIEFYNKVTRIRYADINCLKDINNKDISFSFHSMIQDLFCEDKIIAEQELATLKGEIRLASKINCLRVIFHIGKKEELSIEEINELKQLVNFAEKEKVDLTLENNHSKGSLSGEYLGKISDLIPKLKFCIDLGHLNLAIKKGYVKDVNQLIHKLSGKIVQLHISANNGKSDEHKNLDQKSLPFFKKIIALIGENKIDLIIETRNIDQAKKTHILLKNEIR